MKISPNLSKDALLREIALHAPEGEDIAVSLNRLAHAILADGIDRFYTAATVWYAYLHHESLSKPYKQVIKEYYERKSIYKRRA